MKRATVIGIDLAKNVFHVHGVDAKGDIVIKRSFGRGGLIKFIANLKPCLIGVEACCGAHHWTREFRKYGHTAKMMAPQYVKPYVKTNKNDFNDAEAICEAVQRPNMRFVAEKTVEQQGIQMLHRSRTHFVRNRTRLCNEIRGFVSELGVAVPKGVKSLRKQLPQLLEEEDVRLPEWGKRLLRNHLEYFDLLQMQIEKFEKEITRIYDESPVCKRLTTIPGIGPITATAIVAAVADVNSFKSGRHLSAWLGLVPKQNSSGGKTQLGGISKRGDNYLRTLLIHGGRAVVRTVGEKTDQRSLWIAQKVKTRGKNKAAVAVANKNARVIWKLLKTDETYQIAA